MQLELDGKVIVITGASSGIGRATSLALAGEGVRLALGARAHEALDETVLAVRELGGEVVSVATDLATTSGITALVNAAREAFGRIDGLVTSVGSTPFGRPDTLSEAAWAQAFEMKFLATVRAIQATLPHLRRSRGGRIVMIAGNTAHDPSPEMATSAVINASLGSLASVYARQLAPEGIGVVAVHPGPVRTPRLDALVQSIMQTRSLTKEEADCKVTAAIPDGRVAEPEEIADAVAFLLSPRSAHLTGAPVTIDGAQTWPR